MKKKIFQILFFIELRRLDYAQVITTFSTEGVLSFSGWDMGWDMNLRVVELIKDRKTRDC